MTFAELQSVGGYNLGLVSSAMQKSIRRGDENSALFWATELDMSGYGEYCWKRLRIIASEDIGLASDAAVKIRCLYDNWVDQRKKADTKHGPERLFLVHAVIELSRSKKSRMVDHALIVYYEGPREKRDVPDYAKDMHTGEGRRMGRGVEHFWNEGSQIENKFGGDDPYYRSARTIRN
ncbi:MAG: hypothetical protein L6455_14540 [Kiritimatiellae bacterium]|nr:hypothetical protein [Kiritimatiellia bacterium]